LEKFGATKDEDMVKDYLPCIVFKGEERLIPLGVRIAAPGVEFKELFTNWDLVDTGFDLVVDDAYVKRLNAAYGGRGVLISEPLNANWLTVDEWFDKFGTSGLKLEGVKKFYMKKQMTGVFADRDNMGREVVIKL